MAIANDPPPLAGFPDLGPDGAQVWRRFGDRRHVSQLLSAQVCAHSPAGSGAPSHLELRHSLQVLGCSAGGRPLPPPGLIARDNSGPGLRPTASGCRPRPLVVRGSGQWAGPPHPHLGVILGPSTRPNPALQRAEFFRIFGACGAAPRGGGGAPPTTLILLRNQVNARVAAARPHGRAAGAVSGPVLAFRSAKNREKFSFFLRKVVFVSGWTNGGVAIACGDVAVGGGRGRRLPQWLSSARLGVGPYRARSPRLGRSPALAVSQPTGGRGRHSEGSGRVWLSQTASPSPHLRHPCAGLPSLALREVLFRMATYPPPALKRRWRVPSQPCSLTAPAHV